MLCAQAPPAASPEVVRELIVVMGDGMARDFPGRQVVSLERLPRCSECCTAARGLADPELEAGGRPGGAPVSVEETTDLGLRHDPPLARRFNLAWPGSMAFEGLVGPRVVVVGEVLT